MCAARRRLPQSLALSSLLFLSTDACAQHVSLWGGGGIGTMLAGEDAPYVNGHKIAMLAVMLPGDTLRLRLLKGSLERTRGIPADTGDNDLDYEGYDVVVTPKATSLPLAFALGVARYEEAYHRGYPDQDLGSGRIFVHRWGPHVSALRSWEFGRFFEAWAEADLHYAPYRSDQIVVFMDIGIGVRF